MLSAAHLTSRRVLGGGFQVLLALSEAFDLDVLIGFAMMPFISFMKVCSMAADRV